jgi:hypothetical protein
MSGYDLAGAAGSAVYRQVRQKTTREAVRVSAEAAGAIDARQPARARGDVAESSARPRSASAYCAAALWATTLPHDRRGAEVERGMSVPTAFTAPIGALVDPVTGLDGAGGLLADLNALRGEEATNGAGA